jgi:hypothetical protein
MKRINPLSRCPFSACAVPNHFPQGAEWLEFGAFYPIAS